MHYQHNNNEYKIYSRARMNLAIFNNKPKFTRNKRKIKKVLPIIIVFFIALITCFSVLNFINPVFEQTCSDKAESIATRITNEETSKIMNQYNYETFFNTERDTNGNVQMITADVLKMNQVISDIGNNIQNAIENSDDDTIYLSMGAMTGISVLSGFGPEIPIKIELSGNVETNVRSEFVAQGINQTIHRVYLDVKTNINILTTFSMIHKDIENQVIILENVIVGEIPRTYLNKIN